MLNKTEKKCYEWLKREYSVSDNDIFRIANRSPDFTLKDGKSFECKKIYGQRTIILHTKQLQILQKTNTTILVFNNDSKPIYQINSNNLKVNEGWKHLNIRWVYDINKFGITISLNEELDKQLRIYIAKNNIRSKERGIVNILVQFLTS